MIASRGFVSEAHHVITEDGYDLTLWRIVNPCLRTQLKPFPVLIWHGIMANGKVWLINNPGKLDVQGVYRDRTGRANNCSNSLTSNLPFTLSSCGYDVWVGNNRGTRYSGGQISGGFNRFSELCHNNQDISILTRIGQQYWNFSLTEMAIFDIKNSVQYILRHTRKGVYSSLPI